MADIYLNRSKQRKRNKFLSSIAQSEEKVKARWLKTCAWALTKSEYELNSILSNPKNPVLGYPDSVGAVRLSRTDIDAIESALKELKSNKPKPINPEDDCC
jgi:hypothetical protein